MFLEVKDLSVEFNTHRGKLKAVDQISFNLEKGATLGVVGESGCGKSMTSLALMGLLPSTAKLTASSLMFENMDLKNISQDQYRTLRGKQMSMIFQDALSSLNPSFTIGFQIVEALKVHEKISNKAALTRASELLTEVGIPDASSKLDSYPHQLSGGMCQRVMIAMAIALKPKLLIADEPTTALDVTIQDQILRLIAKIQKENDMSLILITHDIGVVSTMTEELIVMYAGQIVEKGKTAQIIRSPRHPYTQGLLACLPESHESEAPKSKLPTIAGLVPDLANKPNGCLVHPRCQYAKELCKTTEPKNGEVKCHFPLN